MGVLALSGRKREYRGLDLALSLGLLSWMAFLVWQPRFAQRPPGPVDEFIEHLGYQIGVAAACSLAFAGAQIKGRWASVVWAVQVIGGGGLLLAWTATGVAAWLLIWKASNWILVGSALVALAMRWPLYRRDRALRILLLSTALLLYCLVDEWWHHPTGWLATAGMFIYPVALVALWTLVTTQMREQAAEANRSVGTRMRQRIAQDVHDGIGSQLVALLSSLDLRNPEQQVLALSLEQCLLDLKITVDTLHEDSPGLIEGLAMLRYRIQPSLSRLGIEFEWQVEDHPALQQLPSLAVTHALRITQEAVANVMRHSGATRLTLSCAYLAGDKTARIEVIDNGRGLDAAPAVSARQGRGLVGMRRRAQEAGLQLEVSGVANRGTSVRLVIPCPAFGAGQTTAN